MKYLTILLPLVLEIVEKVEEISSKWDGGTKKDLALDLLDDALSAAAVVKPGILPVKPLLLMIAAPLIDKIVRTYNQKGLFAKSQSSPAPATSVPQS